jgi:two-component system, chemotaxis family, sensor kinase CheA
MDKRDRDFLRRLLSTFEVEAREHILTISSGLIALEKTTAADQQLDIIETILREAHSLKGAARAVNLAEIEAICQSLESVFAALKGQEIALSSELFDALQQAVNNLSTLLMATEAGPTAAQKSLISGLLQRLDGIPKGSVVRNRGSADRDPISIPNSALQPLVPSPSSPTPMLAETVRISTAKLDALLLQAEELLSAKLTANQRVAELRDINDILAV